MSHNKNANKTNTQNLIQGKGMTQDKNHKYDIQIARLVDVKPIKRPRSNSPGLSFIYAIKGTELRIKKTMNLPNKIMNNKHCALTRWLLKKKIQLINLDPKNPLKLAGEIFQRSKLKEYEIHTEPSFCGKYINIEDCNPYIKSEK